MSPNNVKLNKTVRRVFSPYIAELASRISSCSGMMFQRCLDIGCGRGELGLAMAYLHKMQVHLMDISEEALYAARKGIMRLGLQDSASVEVGDVHDIPFEDGFFDMVVSRGAVWFWGNHVNAFKEIHRVLAYGGTAYIMGGLTRDELQKCMDRKRDISDMDWKERIKRFTGENSVERFTLALSRTGIANFEVSEQEEGVVITVRKE